MIKIFTTGTFDILHYGHINFLKRAKELGDYLIVGVNVNPDNKIPFYSADERKLMLESIRYVDKVVLLNCQEDKFRYLEDADIFACGEEYKNFHDISRISKYTEVVFLSRTENISTTKIKNHLRKFNTVVVDIDDTIAFHKDRDDIANATANENVINKINELHDKNWKIILFTARGDRSCKTLEEKIDKYGQLTKDWLNAHNVKYDELKFGKPNADYYVDDKNISIEEFLKL